MTDRYVPDPVRHPVMYQSWESLTFLHWPYDPAVIRPLLPHGLELDTFDGAAWVGLVPFLLSGLHPPVVPVAPWVGTFPETNVRTYVRGPDGHSGVWFFTLEADRLLAVVAARTLYRLPYRWASMRVERNFQTVCYRSQRHPSFGQGFTRITVEPGAAVAAKEFDNFLTARYRLYAAAGQRILTSQIEHPPWRLQSAKVIQLEQNLLEHSGVPQPVGTPVAHFSGKLDVRIGIIKSANTKPDSGSSS